MQFEGKEKHIYILSFTNTVHNNHVFTRPPTYTCTDEYKETLKNTKKYPLEKKLRNFFFIWVTNLHSIPFYFYIKHNLTPFSLKKNFQVLNPGWCHLRYKPAIYMAFSNFSKGIWAYTWRIIQKCLPWFVSHAHERALYFGWERASFATRCKKTDEPSWLHTFRKKGNTKSWVYVE